MIPHRKARPQSAGTAADDRVRTDVLAEVTIYGAAGLARLLYRAASGDRAAADIRAAAMVNALPGMSMLDRLDIMASAGVDGTRLAGDLDPAERVALCQMATGIEHLHHRAS
jgi:hypothetical protein